MSAAIISGKTLAAAVKAEAAAKVCALQERGVQPCLAVVLVGENPASQVYVRGKASDCAECGIKSKVIRLPYSQVDKLSEGKPITFYARDPEYNVGDWVEIGDCIPYEIIGQEGNIFTIRSEEGQIKTVTMEDVSPYID